jgi:glycerate kinase
VIVGVGGSATNDGGVGAAQALGARLLDSKGRELAPGGAPLAALARVDVAALDARLRDCEIVVAADVTNPLCGPDGASYVYGPQKGAGAATVRELDAALAHFADVVRRDLGVDLADVPGAGAAGGLAFGLMALCGAKIAPGFDVVAEAAGFAGRVACADAVVTGEGRLDRQSGFGKTTAGVARVAREQGKPVVAIAGSIAGGRQRDAARAFDAAFALGSEATAEESMGRARELLERAAEDAGAWLAGSGLLG